MKAWFWYNLKMATLFFAAVFVYATIDVFYGEDIAQRVFIFTMIAKWVDEIILKHRKEDGKE